MNKIDNSLKNIKIYVYNYKNLQVKNKYQFLFKD